MSNYLLLIYDEKLSKDELEQLSGLCAGGFIEEIEENESNLITYGYYSNYESAELGYCYRLHSENFAEAAHLMAVRPEYIGRFDKENEAQCVAVASFCFFMQQEIFDIEGIGRKARNNAIYYKNIFGSKSPIRWKKVETIEDEYREAFYRGEALLDDLFRLQKYL